MNGDSETRKWILKQGEFRRLYSSLLQKHQGALQTTTDSENDPFVTESGILTNIFRTEAKYIALGAGAVVASLVSLRFIRSKHAISTVFGRTKAEAMRDAEAEGKRMGTDAFQKTFANVVEGLFSFWVGYRCYDYLSHKSSPDGANSNNHTRQPTDSVDAIAALPLCRGRSKISEALCPGWIDVTKQQIPGAYWKALKEGRLRDERIWNAILKFSSNCERRLASEGALRRELSLSDDQPIALPARVGAGDAPSSQS